MREQENSVKSIKKSWKWLEVLWSQTRSLKRDEQKASLIVKEVEKLVSNDNNKM